MVRLLPQAQDRPEIAGIGYTEIDIDDDPDAAEFVASVNGGNRTVPTVKFADGSTMTNPRSTQVEAQTGRARPAELLARLAFGRPRTR